MKINSKYQGEGKILDFGNLIFGSELKPFFITLSFIAILTILFTSNIGFIYYFAVSTNLSIIFTVLSFFTGLFILSLFIKVSSVDPGIILPKWIEDDEQILEPDYAPTKSVTVLLQGRVMKLKFCYTCGFYRPPKTVHCSTCNHCIDRFDVRLFYANIAPLSIYWLLYWFKKLFIILSISFDKLHCIIIRNNHVIILNLLTYNSIFAWNIIFIFNFIIYFNLDIFLQFFIHIFIIFVPYLSQFYEYYNL